MTREIPLYTLKGVPDADVSTHYVSTEDGLGLSLLRFNREPSDDIVLILHGLTTSTDMFIMPEHYNLVNYLLDNGYGDVWCMDFRMSNRHPYNLLPHRFNLDDIALYDYPPALEKIRATAGKNRRIHVIAHCLGSASFMMSLFGKAVEVTSLIANSVGLTPRVPAWSKIKLRFSPFLVENVLGQTYISPQWANDPGITRGKLFAKAVSMFHRECDVPACHMLSLMWGTGWPALYSHENLHDVTHRRGGDLYGPTAMNYYRHVNKMVRADSTALKYRPKDPKYNRLPNNYFQHAAEIRTPVLLTTGADNKVFADSNIVCHQRLEAIVPGRHELKIYPKYGHQDVFMGKDVARDIFPSMLEFIRRHSRPAQTLPLSVPIVAEQQPVA